MKTKTATASMKYFFATLIYLAAAFGVYAQTGEPFSINTSPLGEPTGFINDYAGVIDAATKQQLEKRIGDFKNQTNPPVEFAVAIVKTTGERPIFDYSLAVSRGWKIGSKQDDNPSALLFIAIDDRKYFTQVSKDLEDELPDGLVGSLQRQYLVPAFRQGNYSKGVADTIDAYIKTIEAKQNGTAPPATGQQTERKRESRGSFSISGVICCLGIMLLLLFVFGSFGRRKNRNDHNRWGGGGGGFGGGVLPWIIGSAIANSGSSSSWGSSGSSDWGSSGSGSDWGGFGGGGDFGGGGAGGDW